MKKRAGIKIKASGFIAEVSLPGMLYWSTMEALKFTLENGGKKFNPNKGDLGYGVQESLQLFKNALKNSEKKTPH